MDDSLHSLVVYAVVQAGIWFVLSLPRWSPLSWVVSRFVNSVPNGVKNVHLNTNNQAVATGLPPYETEEEALTFHMFWYTCLVHHSLGAAACLAGYAFASPLFFRVGLSFEIGEGVQHGLQMLHALFYPPGTPPIAYFPKPAWVVLALHHSLGLVVGSVAHIHLSGHADVHLLSALLLFATVPGYFNLPLMAFGDVTGDGAVAKVNIAVQIFSNCFALYVRVVCFFPVVHRLLDVIYTEQAFRALPRSAPRPPLTSQPPSPPPPPDG